MPAALFAGNQDVSVMREEMFLSMKLSNNLTNSDALTHPV